MLLDWAEVVSALAVGDTFDIVERGIGGEASEEGGLLGACE